MYGAGTDPSYASYLYGRAQAMYTFATSYQASYANNTQACIKVHSVSQSCLYASQAEVQCLSAAAFLCMSLICMVMFVVVCAHRRKLKRGQVLATHGKSLCEVILLTWHVLGLGDDAKCCSWSCLLQSLYPSNGFVDELAWAAAWLYSASNSTASNYLSDARKYYAQAVSQQVSETFQWP